MKKIIVEIDGVRHKLVEDKADTTCNKCSLLEDPSVLCTSAICLNFLPKSFHCHFEKEEEVCG